MISIVSSANFEKRKRKSGMNKSAGIHIVNQVLLQMAPPINIEVQIATMTQFTVELA